MFSVFFPVCLYKVVCFFVSSLLVAVCVYHILPGIYYNEYTVDCLMRKKNYVLLRSLLHSYNLFSVVVCIQ